METKERIADLEAALQRRDERIAELTQERDQERELNSDLRDHFENVNGMIEQWREAFDMELTDDGKWGFGEWLRQYDELRDAYRKLLADWNKFVPEYNAIVAPTKSNPGRPIAASPAQREDVLKRRKAGQSLRSIADDTGLSLQTVRTIIDRKDGLDRSTKARLAKIAPDRLKEAHERANRRMRNALPGRINAAFKQDAELRKRLK